MYFNFIGHLLGAAGSVEAAITALSCYHGYMPPNINLKDAETMGKLNHRSLWSDGNLS